MSSANTLAQEPQKRYGSCVELAERETAPAGIVGVRVGPEDGSEPSPFLGRSIRPRPSSGVPVSDSRVGSDVGSIPGVRSTNRLTELEVRRKETNGLYPDGRGLYLQVVKGSKTWLLRFTLGKNRWMGLGSYPDITLSVARESAAKARQKVALGIDPINERKALRVELARQLTHAMPFKECAAAYIEANKAGWKNKKHAKQWTATLATHAYPAIGSLPVGKVGRDDVLKVLEPIWSKIPETASRVRQRIEAVLDWAKARGYRTDDNPARWRGYLDAILPNRAKVRAVEHFDAMPYRDVPAYYATMPLTVSALALRFAILTAKRSGEVRGCAWAELDLDAALWSIPGGRMKSGRPFREPLSAPAVAILRERLRVRIEDDALVFPGARLGKALSDATMRKTLQEVRPGVTVHGFRSSFRDWAADHGYARELAESALAHQLKDKTEAAYQRGDLLERRRIMMQAWADYVTAGR